MHFWPENVLCDSSHFIMVADIGLSFLVFSRFRKKLYTSGGNFNIIYIYVNSYLIDHIYVFGTRDHFWMNIPHNKTFWSFKIFLLAHRPSIINKFIWTLSFAYRNTKSCGGTGNISTYIISKIWFHSFIFTPYRQYYVYWWLYL